MTVTKTEVKIAIAIVIGIIIYSSFWHTDTRTEGKKEIYQFSDAKGFWRGNVKKSVDGYLLTDKLIPLRAIARRPNVPMFSGKEQGPQESFSQVMLPWKPYYVYDYDEKKSVLRVAEKARSKESERFWVLESDVYCWTTREVINVERPLAIYSNLEDARADRSKLKESYVFRYTDHAERRIAESQIPVMMALPVLRREEGKYWSVIVPDPEPSSEVDRPYQVSWLRWDGQEPAVNARLRISRQEFEEYIGGLQKLLYDYRYGAPDEKATAHIAIYKGAQIFKTGEEGSEHLNGVSTTELDVRTKGIPHPSGILVRSIQSELEAENIKKRLLAALQMGNDRSLWDASETAYLETSQLP